jgi:SAM-dependent methyltransferase
MISYQDIPNITLLDRIPLHARTVLDVGCSTGALGAEYKRRNPRARVFGIEIDAGAAAIARTRLDEVAVVNVETAPFPFDLDAVDCIVYGDSLEHLVDPWAVLSQHARRLSGDGTILICVRNVEHWSFADALLRGSFSYEPSGLFDRTHLHWFNLETTRLAIEAAGLIPHDVIGRIFDQEGAARFAAAMSPALAALGVDGARYLRRASPVQLVWRAGRAALERLVVVSTMLASVGGVSEVRVSEPMNAIATDPAVTAIIAGEVGFDAGSQPIDAPKIFIFHRPVFDGVGDLDSIRQLIAGGYIVVCEFDDHPDYMAGLKGKDAQSFRAVHAVQTSTEPLAKVMRRKNPEVAVFPNAIRSIPEPRNYADAGRITLFFGCLNREQDWPPFLDALNDAAEFAGDGLAFQIVHDRGLFDALNTPHKQFTPLCDYETYLDILGRSELSFMPLRDTPFNRCKSDLKALEAAALRVTPLANPLVYSGWMRDGETGLIFNSPDDLRQRLKSVVANPGSGRKIAEAARAYVAGHRMLAYQVADRIAWYRSLWERRNELNAALFKRVPELAAPAAPAKGYRPTGKRRRHR